MITHAIETLTNTTNTLRAGLPLEWRMAPSAPADPMQAPIDPTWEVVGAHDTWRFRKGEANWLYADFTFPAQQCGLALAGTQAWLFIHGWEPFTLWLDGQELFREDHVWMATGPIADPIPFPIDIGTTHRLVLCVTPTEQPNNTYPAIAMQIVPAPCIEHSVETGAAQAQLRFAQALATTPEERTLVEGASACLDIAAVREQRWPAALASIAVMEAALQPLSARAKAMTVHLVGHTHIDMDWQWTWPETVSCIRRDVKAVTDLMTDYPDVTFTHSQVPTYQVVQAEDPDIFARVQALNRAGRWENAAGTWVEGDLMMADGEAIARHILYAKDWTREHLGSEARVLWEPDTFGHPGNMPQLAKLGEFDSYFHWRTNPGGERNWPARWWQGIDGTEVLAFSCVYGAGLWPDSVIKKALNYQEFGFHHALHVWGLGDHGGGLPRFHLRMLEKYRDKPLIPTLRFSTMADMRAAILTEREKLPRNSGETHTLFEGCFTTHALIKWWNRRNEGALLAAEAFAALARLPRRDTLREAWTPVLFNHFHDIFDGAAVHDAYEDAYRRAESSYEKARGIVDEALSALVSPTADGEVLVLANPLGFARTEPVRVALPAETVGLLGADGVPLPVQFLGDEWCFLARHVPTFGCTSYRILTDPAKTPKSKGVGVREDGEFFTVETALATLRIAKASGVIGSYVEKMRGIDLVAYGVPRHLQHVPGTHAELALNVFTVRDEAPNTMTAWLINDILREEHLLRGAEVTLLETGPVCARFRVVHAFRASRIEEEVVIYNHYPRVDCQATIDWHEVGNDEVGVPQLKVAFTASMSAPRLRCEGPFTVVERPADGQETVSQKWADLNGDEFGFSLYNDSRYGYDALGGRLRLTLLRNPYAPDANSDNGRHVVRFAFEPHAHRSNAECVRRGMAFNRPLEALRAAQAPNAQPGLSMQGDEAVVCTALRTAEHSDRLLVRFFNTSEQPCTFSFTLGSGITGFEEVNFLEHPVPPESTLADGHIHTRCHAFQVKTFLVKVGE